LVQVGAVMLKFYYRLAARLRRFRILLALLLMAAVGLAVWAVTSAESGAGPGSDRYLLLAIVGAGWTILLLSVAFHGQHPIPSASNAPSWLQGITIKFKRALTYCLIVVVVICAATLLWFSSATLRLFLNS
jgi:hypothetical protein